DDRRLVAYPRARIIIDRADSGVARQVRRGARGTITELSRRGGRVLVLLHNGSVESQKSRQGSGRHHDRVVRSSRAGGRRGVYFFSMGLGLSGTVPTGTSFRHLAIAWSRSSLLELGLYPNSLPAGTRR